MVNYGYFYAVKLRIIMSNNKIAKNTLLLYFRMLLTILISLYTSRIVIKALGVDDFGIFSVVGAFVSMFSILSASLSSAIMRFFTYELGLGDMERLRRVFITALLCIVFAAVIIFIFAEFIGVWFINYKMVIPPDRLNVAKWVFQYSLVISSVNLLSVPYNAMVIAHERMSFFAYISLVEVIGKLIISFLIAEYQNDRLLLYAFLLCVFTLIVKLAYVVFCNLNFEECKYKLVFDKILVKQMFGFAGWNFIGYSSAILRDQGGNVIINLFFGPAVNAARGVAFQVNQAVYGFVQNFMTALNPQITKSYAVGDKEYMMKLVFIGSRFSFLLLWLLSLPLLLNTSSILNIWLEDVPDYSVLFVQLSLIFVLCESVSQPLITTMMATGNIRNYQIVVGGMQLLNLPISYFAIKLGCPPESIFIVAIIISLCCLVLRLNMLRPMIGISIPSFIKEVCLRCIYVVVLSSIVSLFIIRIFSADTILSLIAWLVLIVLSVLVSIYYVGCKKEERVYIWEIVKKKITYV